MGMIGASDNFSNRRNRRALISDINVTPLVDVMLVLLIVFMVTTPMMVSGIHVDLPESVAAPITGADEPLVISVSKDKEIYIIDTKIQLSDIAEKLRAITNAKMDTKIFVKGDKSVTYGDVINVVSEINAAGFNKVALITSVKKHD